MYCLLAVLMMFGIGIALSLTVFFNIVDITIEGESRYTDKELIKASGVEIGDNLFCIMPSTVEKAIVKKFPYIESAAMKRVLPDGLIIKVKEAEVDSVIEWQGEYALISEKGRLLEGGIEMLPEGEFHVTGFDIEKLDEGDNIKKADRERFNTLRMIKKSIRDNGLGEIDVIALDDMMDLNLLYDGRIIIKMGSATEIDYKIRAAKSVIDLSDSGKTVALLDVSARPAMRLREMDIYDESVWPFSDEMREEYKRVVIKPKPEIPQEILEAQKKAEEEEQARQAAAAQQAAEQQQAAQPAVQPEGEVAVVN